MNSEEFKAYLDAQPDHRQFGCSTRDCPIGAWLNATSNATWIHVSARYRWKNYEAHVRTPNPEWAFKFIVRHDALGQPVTAQLARKILQETGDL